MDSQLDEDIDQLRQLTTAQLRLKYQDLFGQASHSNHKNYLFRRIAWRMQALAQGGLSERARRYAQQITQDADLRLGPPNKLLQAQPLTVASAPSTDPRLPAPGALLVKRYKNIRMTRSPSPYWSTVFSTAHIYKSLSAIARGDGNAVERILLFGLSSRSECRRASQ
jgi:hypothetical protein